jgi:hypothetical protein
MILHESGLVGCLETNTFCIWALEQQVHDVFTDREYWIYLLAFVEKSSSLPDCNDNCKSQLCVYQSVQMEMKMKSEEWTTQKTNFVQNSSMISNSKTTFTSGVCPKRQILCRAGLWSVIPKPHILLRCAQKTNFVKSSSVISNSKTNHLSEVCSDISANGNEIEVRKVDYPKRQILHKVPVWSVIPKLPILHTSENVISNSKDHKYGWFWD